ncbi:TAXI family TRAP transporter solute-binding subunit [Marinicrinis lubricantis]|uniref:TAXI family TRAP transporter solute-binding subunit n=1 Tax=Marinicrinis lubricantis TaxID=2086470 RepID=A0ABW1IP49_9BACL
MRKWLMVTLSLVIVLTLAACGGNNDGNNGGGGDSNNGAGSNNGQNTEGGSNTENEGGGEQAESERLRITIGTGGTSGTYHPLGVAAAQIFSNKGDNITANAVSTDASVANINGIADGTYQIAFVQNDITYYAANGTEMFDGAPVEKVAGFGVLYPEVIQIITTEDSGIETLDDLKGKRVAVGQAASGAELNARQVLEAAGITYDDIEEAYLSFGDASQQLKDNNLDAAFITAGTPTGAVQDLGASNEVKLIPIPDDIRAKLKETYPFYTDFTIPKDTYDLAEDVDTVTVSAILVISKDLSEEEGYRLAQAFYDNTADLAAAHQKGELITLETAIEGMPIDLHPGVAKYFKEKGIVE